MTYDLNNASAALQRTGEALGDAATRLTTLDPGARALGADTAGALGELAGDLHGRWLRALDARAREAAAHGARVVAAAEAVARAATGYGQTDDDAHTRHRTVQGEQS